MALSLYDKWLNRYGKEIADQKMAKYRVKMSNKCSGTKNGFYGKKHTQETIDVFSRSLSGRTAWNKGKKLPEISGNNNPACTPESRKKISIGVKKSYTPELRKIRSDQCLNYVSTPEFRTKMENSGLWRTKDELSDWEYYKRVVLNFTAKSYRKHKKMIDPSELRSINFHLDHIYSVAGGFKNKIDPEIISHPCNLRIIARSSNCKKHASCDITIETLLENINEFQSD